MEGNILISTIRLSRPKNILIIFATMIGVALFVHSNEAVIIDRINFSLLVLSTCLIAAAGNMINDYFDVTADEINKPHKLIISKHLKKSSALILYWSFNAIALITAVYLDWIHHSFLFLITHGLVIIALWYYSFKLKKTLYTGTLLIALLTGLIPLLAMTFIILQNEKSLLSFMYLISFEVPEYIHLIYLFAFFAFMQNLAREICKDINDVPGDIKIKVNSIPIKYGLKRTKVIVAMIILIQFLCLAIDLLFHDLFLVPKAQIAVIIALTIDLIVLILMIKDELFVKYSQRLFKLAMVVGLSALYF
mgnify:CR=1 FL=1